MFAQEFEAKLNVTVNGLYKLTYPMYGTAVYSQFNIDQKVLQVGSILIKSKPGFKMAAIRNNSLANVNVRVELDNQDCPNGLFYTLVSADSQADVTTRTVELCQGWELRAMKPKYLKSMQKSLTIPAGQFGSLIFFYSPIERTTPFRLSGTLVIEES